MPLCDADVIRALPTQMPGSTESFVLEEGHLGAAYPHSEAFRRAIEVECAFLIRHLARPAY